MHKLVLEREKNRIILKILLILCHVLMVKLLHKRQLEKLIQAGSFDSIYQMIGLFYLNNVINFVQIFGGSKIVIYSINQISLKRIKIIFA